MCYQYNQSDSFRPGNKDHVAILSYNYLSEKVTYLHGGCNSMIKIIVNTKKKLRKISNISQESDNTVGKGLALTGSLQVSNP